MNEKQYKDTLKYLYYVAKYKGRKKTGVYLNELRYILERKYEPNELENLLEMISTKEKIENIAGDKFLFYCENIYYLIPKSTKGQPDLKRYYWYHDFMKRIKSKTNKEYRIFFEEISGLGFKLENNSMVLPSDFKIPTKATLENLTLEELEEELGKEENRKFNIFIKEVTKLIHHLHTPNSSDALEISEFTEKRNLTRIIKKFDNILSRQSFSGLSGYLLLLKHLRLIDDEELNNYKTVFNYLHVLPNYLKDKNLMIYIKHLADDGFSLQETFNNFQTVNKKQFDQHNLLQHFFADSRLAPNCMSSDLEEKYFIKQNGSLKWQVTDHPPNSSQMKAIKKALTSRITLIQGPPGTGKTDTILNMMAAIHRCGKTVVVVSSNNNAVDNITDKIDKIKKDKNASPSKKEFAKKYRALGHGKKRKPTQEEKEDSTLEFDKDTCKWKDSKKFLKKYPMISSTIHSLPDLFSDGFTHPYDYVIIDEASQSDVLLGIVAMFFAKNLILVGDVEQLPPVFNSDEKHLLQKLRNKIIIPEFLQMDNEYNRNHDNLIKSILSECQDIFGSKDDELILDEHYRCHSSIIEFCNKYIYKNVLKKNLKKGEDKSQCRIAIRWYQGKYDERCSHNESEDNNTLGSSSNSSRRNMKQVTIFMEEEWPELVEIIQHENDMKTDLSERTSIAIIAPYVGQKDAISKAINEDKKKRNLDVNISELKNEEGNSYNILTIHKVQGREYDIVYVLPVDDGKYEWPWSQEKRLVNVAVSRAIEELRVITSTNMMSKVVCEALPEVTYIQPQKQKKTFRRGKKEDNVYFQKLAEYVHNKWGIEPLAKIDSLPYGTPYRSFGFIKTEIDSIFDRHMEVIQNQCEETGTLEDDEQKESSFEICFENSINQLQSEEAFDFFDYEKGKSLSSIFNFIDMDEEAGNCFHFDFSFFKKDAVQNRKNLLLAVEIDGAPHRTNMFFDKESGVVKHVNYKELDARKDELVRSNQGIQITLEEIPEKLKNNLNDNEFYFLRLPTDGTTYNEKEKIGRLLKSVSNQLKAE